jgi:hypothetical protein
VAGPSGDRGGRGGGGGGRGGGGGGNPEGTGDKRDWRTRTDLPAPRENQHGGGGGRDVSIILQTVIGTPPHIPL